MFRFLATFVAVPFLGVVLGQNPCEPGKLPYVLYYEGHGEPNRYSNFQTFAVRMPTAFQEEHP